MVYVYIDFAKIISIHFILIVIFKTLHVCKDCVLIFQEVDTSTGKEWR